MSSSLSSLRYETAVLLDQKISNYIPYNDYFEYYRPDYLLHLTPSSIENMNDKDYLEKHKIILMEQLRALQTAPSVQMTHVPPDWMTKEAEKDGTPDVEEQDPDSRVDRPHEKKQVPCRRRHCRHLTVVCSCR